MFPPGISLGIAVFGLLLSLAGFFVPAFRKKLLLGGLFILFFGFFSRIILLIVTVLACLDNYRKRYSLGQGYTYGNSGMGSGFGGGFSGGFSGGGGATGSW